MATGISKLDLPFIDDSAPSSFPLDISAESQSVIDAKGSLNSRLLEENHDFNISQFNRNLQQLKMNNSLAECMDLPSNEVLYENKGKGESAEQSANAYASAMIGCCRLNENIYQDPGCNTSHDVLCDLQFDPGSGVETNKSGGKMLLPDAVDSSFKPVVVSSDVIRKTVDQIVYSTQPLVMSDHCVATSRLLPSKSISLKRKKASLRVVDDNLQLIKSSAGVCPIDDNVGNDSGQTERSKCVSRPKRPKVYTPQDPTKNVVLEAISGFSDGCDVGVLLPEKPDIGELLLDEPEAATVSSVAQDSTEDVIATPELDGGILDIGMIVDESMTPSLLTVSLKPEASSEKLPGESVSISSGGGILDMGMIVDESMTPSSLTVSLKPEASSEKLPEESVSTSSTAPASPPGKNAVGRKKLWKANRCTKSEADCKPDIGQTVAAANENPASSKPCSQSHFPCTSDLLQKQNPVKKQLDDKFDNSSVCVTSSVPISDSLDISSASTTDGGNCIWACSSGIGAADTPKSTPVGCDCLWAVTSAQSSANSTAKFTPAGRDCIWAMASAQSSANSTAKSTPAGRDCIWAVASAQSSANSTACNTPTSALSPGKNCVWEMAKTSGPRAQVKELLEQRAHDHEHTTAERRRHFSSPSRKHKTSFIIDELSMSCPRMEVERSRKLQRPPRLDLYQSPGDIKWVKSATPASTSAPAACNVEQSNATAVLDANGVTLSQLSVSLCMPPSVCLKTANTSDSSSHNMPLPACNPEDSVVPGAVVLAIPTDPVSSSYCNQLAPNAGEIRANKAAKVKQVKKPQRELGPSRGHTSTSIANKRSEGCVSHLPKKTRSVVVEPKKNRGTSASVASSTVTSNKPSKDHHVGHIASGSTLKSQSASATEPIPSSEMTDAETSKLILQSKPKRKYVRRSVVGNNLDICNTVASGDQLLTSLGCSSISGSKPVKKPSEYKSKKVGIPGEIHKVRPKTRPATSKAARNIANGQAIATKAPTTSTSAGNRTTSKTVSSKTLHRKPPSCQISVSDCAVSDVNALANLDIDGTGIGFSEDSVVDGDSTNPIVLTDDDILVTSASYVTQSQDDAAFVNFTDVVAKPSSHLNRRRSSSADFEIMNQFEASASAVFDDDQMDDLHDFPVYSKRRSSRRLRRTSIEIYRKSMENTEEEPMMELYETGTTTESTVSEPVTVVDPTADAITPIVIVEDDVCSDTKPSSTDVLNTVKELTTADSTTYSSTGRPQRRCSSQAPPVMEVSTPKTRRKHAAPTVEDIYLNRLWRTQMPKDRMWESIPESPGHDPRTGAEKIFARKVRCAMKFEDAPNVTRLRQRRAKALAHGWRPPTKKRLAALDELLEEKLTAIGEEEPTGQPQETGDSEISSTEIQNSD